MTITVLHSLFSLVCVKAVLLKCYRVLQGWGMFCIDLFFFSCTNEPVQLNVIYV